VDGPRGFGNGCVVPAGPLREPPAALGRADFAVVMDEPAERANQWYGVLAYRLTLVPEAAAMEALRGKPLLAFAGLGHPAKFFAMLQRQGLQVAQSVVFADHQAYTARDVRVLRDLARRLGATPVTTAKDAAKLPEGFARVVEVAAQGPDWPAVLADLTPRLAG
jgi:tetraacyldisaccharide 4'-kinase